MMTGKGTRDVSPVEPGGSPSEEAVPVVAAPDLPDGMGERVGKDKSAPGEAQLTREKMITK